MIEALRQRSPAILSFLQKVTFLLFTLEYLYTVLGHTKSSIAYLYPVLVANMMLLDVMRFVAIAVVSLQLFLDKLTVRSVSLFFCKLAILTIASMFFVSAGEVLLGTLMITAVAVSGLKEDRLLKTAFSIGAVVVVVFFFLALLGIVANQRGDSFGFTYRTHYASFLISMVLVYSIIKDGWFTWLEEIILLLINVYVLWLKAKTSFVCLFVFTVFVLWRHYRVEHKIPFRNKKEYGFISYIFSVIYLPIVLMDKLFELLRVVRIRTIFIRMMKYSFIIWCVINLVLVLTYRSFIDIWKRIPVLDTLDSRMRLSLLGFEEFPIKLFGNYILQIGNSSSETYSPFYFVFDSSYIRLIIQYGLVAFIIVMGLMTFVQFHLYKHGRFFAMFAATIFAMDCFMNYHIRSVAYNAFVVLAFCTLAKKEGAVICDKLKIGLVPKRRRIIGACAVFLALASLFVWCSTAYRITNWRGQIPMYGATLVIPGDYLENKDLLLDAAGNYLIGNPESVCIVNSGEDVQSMINLGIESDRVYVLESRSIDEMLTKSHEFIRTNNLPSRLTVCANILQMERISLRASALHIPINSLSVKTWSGYLSLFASEQWRLLWER